MIREFRLWSHKTFYQSGPSFFRSVLPTVGFIAALIAITTFVITYAANEKPLEKTVYVLAVLLAVFIVAAFMAISAALAQGPERRLVRYPQLIQQMGVATANAYISVSNPRLTSKGETLNELQASLRNVADKFRAVIWCIMNDRLAVSIKVRNEVGDQFYTLSRDPQAREGRPEGVAHTLGTIRGNTEFAKLVGEGCPRQYEFISHDLFSDADAGRYYNSDPHWRNKYSTIATVPIYSENVADGYVLGCLCLDAKKVGLFLKGESLILHLMKQQAALMFPILHAFSQKWESVR